LRTGAEQHERQQQPHGCAAPSSNCAPKTHRSLVPDARRRRIEGARVTGPIPAVPLSWSAASSSKSAL
jgi:hypothetical protein